MTTLTALILAVVAFAGLAAIGALAFANRRLLEYVANLAVNQHAQQMSVILTASPFVGRSREHIVASGTTTRGRLDVAAYAVQAMMLQTARPDRIDLFLADDIAPGEIPEQLRALEAHGLTLHFVPDVGPHTKLVYALEMFPGRSIVTFDDDVIYPPSSLAALLATARACPGAVVGNWVRKLAFTPGGKVRPAKAGKVMTPKWQTRNVDRTARPTACALDLFAYGTGGVLYPPGCMDPRVTDVELFRRLCPTEDDVWFKAMTLLTGTPVAASQLGHAPRHQVIQGSQAVALRFANYDKGAAQTTSQIRAVFEHFDLYSRLWRS